MKVTRGKDVVRASKLRTTITGAGGASKTTLALSVPPEWGKIGYIAADPTSPALGSCPDDRRDDLIVIEMDGNSTRDATGKVLTTDWLKEAYEIAQRDWLKDFPEMGVIVWDTMTQTAQEVMRESAVKNWFSDKGPSTGMRSQDGAKIMPKVDQGQKYAQPQQGDFNMAQQAIIQVSEWFATQPLHVIALFQEIADDPNPKTGEGLIFGPCTVGTKGPRHIPQRFSENLGVYTQGGLKPGDKPTYHVQMMPGNYRGYNVKTSRPELLTPTRQLKDLEDRREFWRFLLSLKTGATAATVSV